MEGNTKFQTPFSRCDAVRALMSDDGGERAMMIRVASSKAVAIGRMHVFNVEGTKVNVANVNGRLYAFDDACTHAGCSLSQGHLHGTTVTCPCHGSKFDVTSGAVLRGPATRPLRTRLVQVEHEELLTEA